MRITKTTGAILSLLIMSVYLYFYYNWVQNLYYSLQLTLLFFFGIFLHFLRKIEAGTVAELVFFEQSTGHYWDNGFCLVPSVFPALHNIGIYLLWNLKKDVLEKAVSFNPNINIEHHHWEDQRLHRYSVDTKSGLLASTTHKALTGLGNWFLSINDKNPELVYQKLGFRIVLVSLFFGFVGNFWPGKSSNQPSKTSGTTQISVQLDDGGLNPVFPTKEMFEEVVDEKYTDIGGISFLHYRKTDDGTPPVIFVENSLCAIVPAGKEIAFKSKFVPRFVANMKKDVNYFPKAKYLSLFTWSFDFMGKLYFGDEYRWIESKPWKQSRKFWHKLDFDNFILAKAREQKDIPDAQAGGFVCF